MIAVTGASGHLGATLVRRLVDGGARVRAVVRDDQRALEGLPVERVRADVTDAAAVRAALDGAEVVYHLAAKISLRSADAPELEAVNVGGTRHVVAACLDARVRRLVHVSSIHALAPEPAAEPVDERRGPADGKGTLPYDRSKARGEAEVRAGVARGLDAVIVNPTAMIGPFDYKPSELGAFFIALCRRTLPGLVAADFDWVDARDAASGAVTACERGRTGERYLLTGHRRSLRELAELVHELTGARPPRMVSPMWLARVTAPFAAGWSALARKPPLYTSESLLTLRSYRRILRDKAERELDYQPRPIRRTVEDTLAWLREAGFLDG